MRSSVGQEPERAEPQNEVWGFCVWGALVGCGAGIATCYESVLNIMSFALQAIQIYFAELLRSEHSQLATAAGQLFAVVFGNSTNKKKEARIELVRVCKWKFRIERQER